MQKTLKKGGLLKTNSVSKIKSIGFEFETSWFAKLSEYNGVLFNSGSNSNSISAVNKLFQGDIEEHEAAEQLYNIEYQQEEYFEENIDSNTVFHITNDYSNGETIRKLKKICDATLDSKDIYEFQAVGGSTSLDNTVFPIQLIQSKANTNCYEFSFVEWLYTKYAPNRSSNLIIQSFMEMMQYLINHLDSLVPMEGELKMKISNKKKTKFNYITIDEPQKRLLYHKPNTNLYYLQLHSDNQQKTIDDICGKAQMTFGCDIKDAISIMKNISDGILKERIIEIEKVSKKIMHKASINSTNAINYLTLILYRVYIYLEYRKAQSKYMKNLMAFNCRHSNYILFDELVNSINIIDNSISIGGISSTALTEGSAKGSANGRHSLIDIIMQPDILSDIFDTSILTRVIDQDNDHYGNPGYSLRSYFEYIISEEEDWLLHIDSTTKRQLVYNNIVLIEYRLFQHYLSNHLKTYYPKVIRESGSCSNHSNIYSIGQYRELLKLYNEKSKSSKARTRKTAWT